MVEVMKAISALVTACTAESMKSTLKNISVPQKLKGYSHLFKNCELQWCATKL